MSRAPRPKLTRKDPAPETRLLRELQSAMGDAELALSRRMQLSHTDLSAMAHLSFAPEHLGPGELSGRLGISPAAATQLVDRLERAGHLERRRDAVDRRRVQLVPTASALQEVGTLLQPLLSGLDAAVRGYTAEERATVTRYLTAVLAAYREFAADD
jgi:DNA-binding MarR family transcriptional regulator